MTRIKKSLALATACCLASGIASAAVDVKTNGFLTAGAAMIDEPDSTTDSFVNDRLGFEYDSRMGLQFSAKVNPQLEFTSQLLSRARIEGWDVKADWAFAEYKLNKNVSVRAGRIRLPLYLASEYVEVGYAYPWVRPPAEVYRLVPVNALSGVSTPLKANLSGMDLLVQPFAGSLNTDLASRGLVVPVVADNMAGASIDLSNDTVRFHAMYFTAKVQADVAVPIPLCGVPLAPPCPSGLGTIYGSADVAVLDTSAFSAWDVGMTVDWRNIVLMTEYAQDNAGTAMDNQFGWYATLGYKMGNVLPYVTYAQRRSDKIVDDPNTAAYEPALISGFHQSQDSIALGLRYNVGNASALKFEVMNASAQDDTCGLMDASSTVPGACSGNFPVNGSYNMYSVAYDVVF